jgi:hypothetical protein
LKREGRPVAGRLFRFAIRMGGTPVENNLEQGKTLSAEFFHSQHSP